jgi:hypothetical protein
LIWGAGENVPGDDLRDDWTIRVLTAVNGHTYPMLGRMLS